MRILIDVCLSPEWANYLRAAGYVAVHWSTIGSLSAADTEIMAWAKANNHVVFTHDLDFGALLANSQSAGPSVVQLRDQDTDPQSIGFALVAALRQFSSQLEIGAIVTVDVSRRKVRLLPLN